MKHTYTRLDIPCGAAAAALRSSVFSWLVDAIAGGLILFFSVPLEKKLFLTQVRIISTPRIVCDIFLVFCSSCTYIYALHCCVVLFT